MNIPILTLVHITASVAALLAGLITLGRLFESRTIGHSTRAFLATTLVSVVTGFLFPLDKFTPAIAVGVLCVPLLVVASIAIFLHRLASRWFSIYAISAVSLVYLNTLVLGAQLLMKVPALKEIAPSEKAPVFVVVQLVILIAFGVLGHGLWRSIHRQPAKERA